MPAIKFVSHQEFPEDPYTKELVYLEIEDKYRVAYVRKPGKNGGLFWTVPTISALKDGVKNYFDSFMQDSSFLDQDIKNFLNTRAWEKKSVHNSDEIPF